MQNTTDQISINYEDVEQSMTLIKRQINRFHDQSLIIFNDEMTQISQMISDFTEQYNRILECLKSNDIRTLDSDILALHNDIEKAIVEIKATDDSYNRNKEGNTNERIA